MVQTLPLNVEFGGITKANIQQLKLINVSTLPVRYSDKFYRDLVELGNESYMKFAIWNGFTIGAVCARSEYDEVKKESKLYIMTLNVLPAYRRRGVASSLLLLILKEAIKDGMKTVYLNVQTSNDEAIQFYARHDFANVAMLPNYYKRIEPADCYVLELNVEDYQTKQEKLLNENSK